MLLTKDQIDAVRNGDSVRFTEAGTDLVVLRADLFEQMLRYEARPWTDEEMDLLAAVDANRLGWEGLETYQEQSPRP